MSPGEYSRELHAQKESDDELYMLSVAQAAARPAPLTDMTPEEVNRRIAEAVGWTSIEPCTCTMHNRFGEVVHALCGIGPSAIERTHLPNYHGSLDAMVEAERTLEGNQKLLYWLYIQRQVSTGGKYLSDAEYHAILCAPASVRALAFLMAKTQASGL